MNSLHPALDNHNIYASYQEASLINQTLPIELFEKVLSYLDDTNMKVAATTSHFWNAASVDTAKRQELSNVKTFAQFLAENLHKKFYEDQCQRILNIIKKAKILESNDLIQIGSSIKDFKKDVLDILKDVKLVDLKNLELLSTDKVKPKFFEDLFFLSTFDRTITEINKLNNDIDKSNSLCDFSLALQENHIDRAIQVVHMIPISQTKSWSFFSICNNLITNGCIDKAIEIADMLTDQRHLYLYAISIKLINTNNIDKAIEIADMLTDQRDFYLYNISIKLINTNNIDKAIEIADMLTDQRDFYLYNISIKLINTNNIDKAIEIADMLTDQRDFYLYNISMKLIDTNNINKTVKIANKIDSLWKKAEIFIIIFIGIIRKTSHEIFSKIHKINISHIFSVKKLSFKFRF